MILTEYSDVPEWFDEADFIDSESGDDWTISCAQEENPDTGELACIVLIELPRRARRVTGWRRKVAVTETSTEADRAMVVAWLGDRMVEALTAVPGLWMALRHGKGRHPLTVPQVYAWSDAFVSGDSWTELDGQRFTIVDPTEPELPTLP